MRHSEVDVDFAVYSRFAKSKYRLHKCLFSGRYSEPVFIELPRDFKSDGGKHDLVIKLKKSLYGQAEAARLWYEKLLNGLLEQVL